MAPLTRQIKIAYLETWYHVAAVLSCRFSGPGTAHYARRLVSSDRILALIGHGGFESLPPLPLIPYAMSMSMTVLYRAFRDGERDAASTATDLQHCYDALKGLSRHWTSVRGLSRMTKRLLKHLAAQGQDGNSGSTISLSHGMVLKANGTSVPVGESSEQSCTLINTSPAQQPIPPVYMNGYVIPQMSPDETQCQLADLSWSDMDVSSFPFDWTINDMFDFGMPNIFRDHII